MKTTAQDSLQNSQNPTGLRTLVPSITRRWFGVCLALGMAAAGLPSSFAEDDGGESLCSGEATAGGVCSHGTSGAAQGILTVMTDFEGGGHLQPIAAATDHWIPGTGMRFGPNWRTSVRPPGTFSNNPSGNVVATWTTGLSQLIEFEEPVFEVFLHYASRGAIQVDALDAEGNVVVSVPGAATHPLALNTWVPLSVQMAENSIVAVRITGQALGRTGVDDVGYSRHVAIEVPIDVKPGNENEIDPINLKAKGSLPLAVFSTPDFDATTLDLCTLQLGDPDLIQIATVVSGSADDLNGDGLLDLVLHFSASQLVDGGAINAGTTELLLTGGTTAGQSIFGKDQVRIVGGGN